MTIVLDTNTLVQIFGAKAPLRSLQEAVLDGKLVLALSTAILLEYEEVLTRYGGSERWQRVWRVLELTAQLHNSIQRVEPAYFWGLISADPDDDKFVDCAIAAGADWIITEDSHLDVLKRAGHKPQPITPAAFVERVLTKL